MVYRQAVSSEDMFLQLGNKTPMTSSCEELVVSYPATIFSLSVFHTSLGILLSRSCFTRRFSFTIFLMSYQTLMPFNFLLSIN